MSEQRGDSTPDSVGSAEADRLAAAYLSRVAEPASVPLWMFVNQHGYQAAAAAVRAGDVPPAVAACTEARRKSADPFADLAAAERNGIRLLSPADDEWPHFAFAALAATAERRVAQWCAGQHARPGRGELIPPLALWVRGAGSLRSVGVQAIAVVGSRAATGYGEQIAADFCYHLARRGVVVVSGGAYGIDAAAHRGVLAADGVSVLVSAAGVDRPYPSGNRALYERTVERGLVISERPPGSAPHRQRFLSRNRIIAALGTATLVVQAGARSGALNTAGYARDLGRPVLAVPGPISSAMSVGCHRLLQRPDEPAHLVTSVEEVLSFCGGVTSGGTGTATTSAKAGPVSAGYEALDLVARSVLDGFPARGVVTEANLARLSGQPIQQVIGALPALLALGLVTVSREGYRLARSSVAS
ncbi:MAG TPA: DNA-processing protein DprA [Jatrophihabitans sp.]|nr:DNA-processing protein DprA [Jatrophihabitans sp.]